MTSKYTTVPELKGFFDCTETEGNFLTDAISGLKWDVSPNGYRLIYDTLSNGIGTTTLSSSPPINFIGGTSPTISTDKDYLYVVSGRITGDTDFRCSVGDINQILPEYSGIWAGMGIADPFHGTLGSVADGTITVSAGSPSDKLSSLAVNGGSFDVTILYMYSGSANTLQAYAYNTQTAEVIFSALTYTDHAVLPDITPNPCFRLSGIELYGAQLWEFSVFPADVLNGALWMGKEWSKGRSNRTLYPAWAGRSAGIGFSI